MGITPMQAVTFQIERMVIEEVNVRDEYVRACRSLARTLEESAEAAQKGRYVSGSPMSSSYVQDITRLAERHAQLSERLSGLRYISETFSEQVSMYVAALPRNSGEG